jgi:signal transduction histidine kinase
MRRIETIAAGKAVKDEFRAGVAQQNANRTSWQRRVLQRRGPVERADQAAALADIHDEASRLQGIIDNLLVLARRAKRADRAEPVLLRASSSTSATGTRAAIRTALHRYETGLPPVLAASIYVEQVVANLLSNAEKYSPTQMPIDIEIARDGARLRVSVSDRGVGIPPDEIDRVFTAFYRSPRTADRAQGFGIGLAVCKRLIEAQDGRMWAEPRIGGGTRFAFDLAVAGSASVRALRPLASAAANDDNGPAAVPSRGRRGQRGQCSVVVRDDAGRPIRSAK